MSVEHAGLRRPALVASCVAVASAAAVFGIYLLFVRTQRGQEIDDLAFDGRSAVSLQATQRTDRLLNAVTHTSLFVLGAAIVLLALAQRRVRLAIVCGACMAGAVVTTEVLKLYLLTRPRFGGVGGFAHNSYPSGHATIGMVLSLGPVMVSASSSRRLATLAAALVATAFGTAVLASGWHRPSDSLGAYAVAFTWFAAGHAVMLWLDHHRPYRFGVASEREGPMSRPLLVWAGIALLGFTVFALWRSLEDHDLHAVAYARMYLVFCVAIDVVGIVGVLAFAVLTGDRARRRREAVSSPSGLS